MDLWAHVMSLVPYQQYISLYKSTDKN